MKPLVAAMAVVLCFTFLTLWFGCGELSAEMPTIPESLTPVNGSVVEYWPNQQVRSERIYTGGEVESAVYYSSDGQVVFEMVSDGV